MRHLLRPDEIAAIAKAAHHHGLKLHMDGARFANALAFARLLPAELTWQAGVDVLCFGATKNGAMAAEAVVFFDSALAGNSPSGASAAAICSPRCGFCRRSSTPISTTGCGWPTPATPT